MSLQENFKIIRTLNNELKSINADNIEGVIEKLPTLIESFKESAEAKAKIDDELNRLREVINSTVHQD